MKAQVLDVYHGTDPLDLPQILAEGYLPGVGAGSDALKKHYFLTVPVVYTAKSWEVAMYYPNRPNTNGIKGVDKNNGTGGGSLVALDGTPGFRCVVRNLVDTTRTLVQKDRNQSGFMPGDLFPTHVCLCAVHPNLFGASCAACLCGL